MSYRLLFTREYCPDGRGHHSLSQDKNVNDPASAPPIPGWGGGGRGNKMIAALIGMVHNLPVSDHTLHYASINLYKTSFKGLILINDILTE